MLFTFPTCRFSLFFSNLKSLRSTSFPENSRNRPAVQELLKPFAGSPKAVLFSLPRSAIPISEVDAYRKLINQILNGYPLLVRLADMQHKLRFTADFSMLAGQDKHVPVHRLLGHGSVS